MPPRALEGAAGDGGGSAAAEASASVVAASPGPSGAAASAVAGSDVWRRSGRRLELGDHGGSGGDGRWTGARAASVQPGSEIVRALGNRGYAAAAISG